MKIKKAGISFKLTNEETKALKEGLKKILKVTNTIGFNDKLDLSKEELAIFKLIEEKI